jgi:hypothetical protein
VAIPVTPTVDQLRVRDIGLDLAAEAIGQLLDLLRERSIAGRSPPTWLVTAEMAVR